MIARRLFPTPRAQLSSQLEPTSFAPNWARSIPDQLPDKRGSRSTTTPHPVLPVLTYEYQRPLTWGQEKKWPGMPPPVDGVEGEDSAEELVVGRVGRREEALAV